MKASVACTYGQSHSNLLSCKRTVSTLQPLPLLSLSPTSTLPPTTPSFLTAFGSAPHPTCCYRILHFHNVPETDTYTPPSFRPLLPCRRSDLNPAWSDGSGFRYPLTIVRTPSPFEHIQGDTRFPAVIVTWTGRIATTFVSPTDESTKLDSQPDSRGFTFEPTTPSSASRCYQLAEPIPLFPHLPSSLPKIPR